MITLATSQVLKSHMWLMATRQHGHQTLPLSWKVLVDSTAVKREDDTLKRCVISVLKQWVWFPKFYCLPIALPEQKKEKISLAFLFMQTCIFLSQSPRQDITGECWGLEDSGDQGQVKVKRTLIKRVLSKHRTCAAVLCIRAEAHAPSTTHTERPRKAGWRALSPCGCPTRCDRCTN